MSTAVVDACVLVDALLPGPENDPVRDTLTGLSVFAAPEHVGIEVLNVFRRQARTQDRPLPTLDKARFTLAQLRIQLVPVAAIHDRIWALRHTLTAYDAAYAATAEHLGVPLLTSDHAFTNHPDIHCTITDPRHPTV